MARMGYPSDDDIRAAHERPAPPAPKSTCPQSRPGWDLWFMRQAFVVAQRGSCRRKQVGALVVRDRDHRVVSGGYNGAPQGMPDCLEAGCELREISGKQSCVRTIHAESNALDLCGPLSESHTMFCTVIPCRDCTLRIIQRRCIYRVVYFEYYESRNTADVITLFENASIELVKLDVPINQVVARYED
jgi:dCMP deaminase